MNMSPINNEDIEITYIWHLHYAGIHNKVAILKHVCIFLNHVYNYPIYKDDKKVIIINVVHVIILKFIILKLSS